jgi:hypothetical protein
MGHTPIAPFPNIDEFKPILEQELTLPMAAAWFIWRSIDAVREQWINFCRAWLANADPANHVPLMEVSIPSCSPMPASGGL